MVTLPAKSSESSDQASALATQKLDRPDFRRLLETQPQLLGGPVRFPAGERLLPKIPFNEQVFETVHDLIERGQCTDGRFEIETGERRLTCLIHRGKLYFSGLLEGDAYSVVPLGDFPQRAREMVSASCRLIRADPTEILITAVHFAKEPALRGSVRFVDPAKVLQVLEKSKKDAALSFLRGSVRTLLFLHKGKPARLFFGDPREDPGEGSLEERMLLLAFGPNSGDGIVEVFTDLRLPTDPDAGSSLKQLVSASSPAPPATVFVHMNGNEVRQRPFTAPSMVIGRDPKVDIFIDNLGVSRRHASLSWDRGGFFVEDLGSSNGTFVGEARVERHRLNDQDKIRIGKFDLTVVRTAQEQQASETLFVNRRDLSGIVPPPVVQGDGVRCSLKRELLVGKGRGVDLQAKGWGVSAVHAKIVASDVYGRAKIACFGNNKVSVGRDTFHDIEVGMGQEFRFGRSVFSLTPSSGEDEG